MRKSAILPLRMPVQSHCCPHVWTQTPAAALMASALLLVGCASVPAVPPIDGIATQTPAQWHAPLPHGGRVADLQRWWAQFDDPVLLQLIEAAQEASPTLAGGLARIADARATRVARDGALMPVLDGFASGSRARTDLGVPMATGFSAGLQAGWEMDVFGAGRAAASAADARVRSSQADWHRARVAVAAEVATTYVELRACEALVDQAERDATSRARTAQATRLAVDAGFRPPAAGALAEASAAQGNVTLVRQRAQCDLLIKVLTALTAVEETGLRRDLAVRTGVIPRPTGLDVSPLPAEVLAQRPDVLAASLDVIAASADADQARAQRWPRIALTGSIGMAGITVGGVSTDGAVLSIGPLTVTLPLFDGGARRANAEAAHVRYESARTLYAHRLREAIREVESAFVALHSAHQRSQDSAVAATGFSRSYDATEAAYRVGIGSLFDLEDARRALVSAQTEVIELERDRTNAWIGLYRAVGGGWSSTETSRRDAPSMTWREGDTPNAHLSAITSGSDRHAE